MATIWKWPIVVTTNVRFEAPSGSVPLCAGPDPTGMLCIWAKVRPENESSDMVVNVVGTGHPLPPEDQLGDYVSTVKDGPFMWHVFARMAE